MAFISLLLPSISSSEARSPDEILKVCEKHLGLGSGAVELFKLVPLKGPESGVIKSQENEDFLEIAVRLSKSDFSLHNIETTLTENEDLK